MFDFSWAFRGVNTDFFFNFVDIFLISPTSDQSDLLLKCAVRTVLYIKHLLYVVFKIPIIFVGKVTGLTFMDPCKVI